MKNHKYLIITISFIAIIALGVNASAQSGKGWGEGRGYHGQGWHQRGYHGQRYYDQLTVEEFRQLEQNRAAFFKETQDIRVNLFSKERELRNELTKDEPDVSKASQLQKEISELQAQFDQKHLAHIIKMRKINPNAGRGFMRGGPMTGYGYHGSGSCWQ